jgi:hypothetical protein
VKGWGGDRKILRHGETLPQERAFGNAQAAVFVKLDSYLEYMIIYMTEKAEFNYSVRALKVLRKLSINKVRG